MYCDTIWIIRDVSATENITQANYIMTKLRSMLVQCFIIYSETLSHAYHIFVNLSIICIFVASLCISEKPANYKQPEKVHAYAK